MSRGDTSKDPMVASDAVPHNWVDSLAPVRLRPYLRLMRLDRPIGSWLLLLPCVWSLSLVSLSLGLFPSLKLALLFAIGAIVMRGAGCTYNDILDRDIDSKVERTRSRPIPSGQISLLNAWIFLCVQCLIGLAVLLQLNFFSIILGASSLLIVAIYPLMKRFTYWPQLILGLAFNWGALLGWASVKEEVSFAAIALYVAGISWTIGYDTIYAHQDREDDALLGLKSTALKFGKNTRTWLAGFYCITALSLLAAGYFAQTSAVYYVGILIASAHLAWQTWRLDIDDGPLCLKLFKSNRDFGLLVLGAMLLDIAL